MMPDALPIVAAVAVCWLVPALLWYFSARGGDARALSDLCAACKALNAAKALENADWATEADASGWTAMHHVAKAAGADASGDGARIATLLLEQGADVMATTHHDSTALHVAACNGSSSVADVLVRAGGSALLEAKDNKGNTALLRAAQHGFFAVATVLVAAGANKSTTNVDGQSAAARARAASATKIVDLLEVSRTKSVTLKSY